MHEVSIEIKIECPCESCEEHNIENTEETFSEAVGEIRNIDIAVQNGEFDYQEAYEHMSVKYLNSILGTNELSRA